MKSINRNTKIRNLYKNGKTCNEIGEYFGLTHQRISQILNWKPKIKDCKYCNSIVFIDNDNFRMRKYCNKCSDYFSNLMGRDRTRALVRKRDNYTCQECGLVRTPEYCKKNKKYSFDVHHLNGLCGKKSRDYDKKEEMSGLITLCHKCHYRRHDFSQRLT